MLFKVPGWPFLVEANKIKDGTKFSHLNGKRNYPIPNAGKGRKLNSKEFVALMYRKLNLSSGKSPRFIRVINRSYFVPSFLSFRLEYIL